MNNNLLQAIQQMLFMSDQQVLSNDIKKINFKKNGWWKKYTWTAKTEERFIEWLTDYLKKNWDGVSEYQPTTLKQRKDHAQQFVAFYGPITRKLNINDFMSIIPWGQLDEVMSKKERESFNKLMFGQTTSPHGVYRHDSKRWLD